ncbi:hypothetical protein YYC_03862 [Plasmodium yoelii 17X]|uniref:YIR protein n=1 Tax=Plasmodium yoelii 17X TaxID=1323249 RepID=V7PHS1_PLAYE|nr:hypothetical protein YYC_03862 [Plasmodium yoelii 17X]
MDIVLCTRFSTLRAYLPDESGKSTEYDFNKNGNIKNYCPNQNCNDDINKINAGCLWLFEQLFVKNKKKINIADYIIIWLSYMLNLKKESEITKLNDFYSKYIEKNTHYTNCDNNGQDCSESLKGITGYKNYKEIIDTKKGLLNINSEYMSKFYEAFKPLCSMYTELDANDRNNKKYLDCAKEFVEKYEKLNVSDNTKDSSYYQVLSTLSNDYNNFKEFCKSSSIDCNDIPRLPEKKTTNDYVKDSEHISEVTSSSSSVTNKLIIVLSIFATIIIFWGISYKYSLFGFRKRVQKHLRKKLKK